MRKIQLSSVLLLYVELNPKDITMTPTLLSKAPTKQESTMALRLRSISMFIIILVAYSVSPTTSESDYDCSESLSRATLFCKIELQRVISTGDKSLIGDDCCLQLVCINEATCAPRSTGYVWIRLTSVYGRHRCNRRRHEHLADPCSLYMDMEDTRLK